MSRRFSRLVVYLLLAAFAQQLQSLSAQAANFKLSTDPKKTCSAIKISGELVAGDYDHFVSTLKKAAAIAPLRRLYLNSIGGQLLAAIAITDLARKTAPNVETIVPARQMCNSACVIVLSAGSQVYISRRATVIVHRAFNANTGKSDINATKTASEFMVFNGMSPNIIQTMGNLRPKQQIQITRSNAKKLGFGNFNFYSGTNSPATPDCAWAGPGAAKN